MLQPLPFLISMPPNATSLRNIGDNNNNNISRKAIVVMSRKLNTLSADAR